MQPTLVIFVKAPMAGRVKTRLCPPLTSFQAATLYRAFAKDTLALACRVRSHAPVVCHVAYEPHAAAPDPSWLGNGFAWSCQRGTALGARLTHAVAEAFARGADPLVIIGSDTPDLPPERIAEAFDALRRHQLVMGPASDGGYYLIGLRRPLPRLFQAVEWSTPRVFAQTLARAADLHVTVAQLPPRRDLDTWADVAAWRRTAASRAAVHTRRRLAAWVRRGRLSAAAARGTVRR